MNIVSNELDIIHTPFLVMSEQEKIDQILKLMDDDKDCITFTEYQHAVVQSELYFVRIYKFIYGEITPEKIKSAIRRLSLEIWVEE